jgi:predicted esterase
MATLSVTAQTPSAPRPVTIETLPAGTFRDPQGIFVSGLPYRLFVPADYNPQEKYPLVLFLHGAGERGVDNRRQGANGGLLFAQPHVQAQHPCFVLLPQCPQAHATFQVLKADRHPCGLHEFGVDAKGPGITRVALPVGQYLRGKRQTMVLLTESNQRDKPVELVFSNFRLSRSGADKGRYLSFKGKTLTPLTEGFVMEPTGCYCTERPATTPPIHASTLSEDGRSIHLKSAPGGQLRLGVDLPCDISPKSVLYFDLQPITPGYGQRIGFLEGDRLPEYRWVNTDWAAKTPHTLPAQPSHPMRLTLGLLGELQKQYAIDPSRIYVTGLSMGGYGTWDIIARRPDLFAAAIPVCGGGDPLTAPAIARLPLWAFHGGNDGVVPTVRTRLMIEALTAAGATPRYTEYPGVGHDSWNRAYAEPDLVAWLFAQRRK